jgi:hypothetical protein
VAIETREGRVLDRATWIRLALMALIGYLAIIWVSSFVPLPPFGHRSTGLHPLLDD